MDRLIIESALSDVDDIWLSDKTENGVEKASIVLEFKGNNLGQVINAMETLMEQKQGIEFIICKTFQSGIYDIELKCDGFDEPIRLMNKAISHEKLGAIEDFIQSNKELMLTANASMQGSEVKIVKAAIKDCSVKA